MYFSSFVQNFYIGLNYLLIFYFTDDMIESRNVYRCDPDVFVYLQFLVKILYKIQFVYSYNLIKDTFLASSRVTVLTIM